MNAATRLAAGIAAALTVLLLQATIIDPLTAPVPVSLPALVVALVAIIAGPGVGLGFGFALGLLADLGSDHPAGLLALCWLGIGVLGGQLGGPAVERGYSSRGIAVSAAVLAGAAELAAGLMLAALGSHGATAWLAVRDVVPVVVLDCLLGLGLVVPVRALLRSQGLLARRPRAELVGRMHVG
ncbi:hypothetical protein M6D93_06635 [Jatrophihabitans telluris]|uniref:Rod shape-determining protein MreD n=1 Tax=Jatrophihabitans telluris TaxID=2038343 RepID=A0ABY4R3E0_9ACTN|nr:hypothetical protein [Jatrophihabitans telluris]UQX89671.1 hypothetical protein M6D93_06635 [Jatrophihabitans telluris]